MDKHVYLHYCNILLDKLNGIELSGLHASRIHDINNDKGTLLAWIYNLDSEWFDVQIKDKEKAKNYSERLDKIIKRVEDNLISYVYPNMRSK